MCRKNKKIKNPDAFVSSLGTGQVDGNLIPASVLTQAVISSFLSEDCFWCCYLSITSLIIPEGQANNLSRCYTGYTQIQRKV